jgi:flagellum-specific peptidoglycan hydrolase FlgJ
MAGRYWPEDLAAESDALGFKSSTTGLIDAFKDQAKEVTKSIADTGRMAVQAAQHAIEPAVPTLPALQDFTKHWDDGQDTPQAHQPSQPAPTLPSRAAGQDSGNPFSLPDVRAFTRIWDEPEKPKQDQPSVESGTSANPPAGSVASARPVASGGTPSATPTGQPASEPRQQVPSAPETFGAIAEGDPEKFFATAGPYARRVEQQTGVPAALSLAIAANETGYGQRRYMAGANNFHGIHAQPGEAGAVPYKDWRPDGSGGQQFYDASQRSFADPGAGFAGFASFIRDNKRYAPAMERYQQTGDVEQLARDIHGAGYAEDPQWSNKLISIMRGIPTSTGVGEVTAQAGVKPTASTGAPAPVPTQEAAQIQQQAAGGDLTPDQAALDDPDKWSLCGPVAAVAMARAKGGNWTVAQAKALAQQNGLWNASQGMGGLSAEAKLLAQMGVSARAGGAEWGQIVQDVGNGNPVTLSTRWIPDGHYVVLEKYDPETGRYYVGGAGNTLKKTTGMSKWMTADQIQALGPVEGALYFDNPATPAPSVVAGRSPTAGVSPPAGFPSSPPASGGDLAAAGRGLPPDSTTMASQYGGGQDMFRAGLGDPSPMPEDASDSERFVRSLSVPNEPRPGTLTNTIPYDAETNTYGPGSPNPPERLSYRQPLSMPPQPTGDAGSGDEPGGRSLPMGVTEKGPAGYRGYNPGSWPEPPAGYPSLDYPLDDRPTGERPYDVTDDDGVDRSKDGLISPTRPNPAVAPGRAYGVPDSPRDSEITPISQMYRQPLQPTDPEASTGDQYNPDDGPRESGYTLPASPATYGDAGDEPQVPTRDDTKGREGTREDIPTYGPPLSEAGPEQPSLVSGLQAVYDTAGNFLHWIQGQAQDIGNTVATEGVATPIGRAIAAPIRSALGKSPEPPATGPEQSIDRAIVETGRSLGRNVDVMQSGFTSGDYGEAAMGALGAVGDLAPSTTLARQLNEMTPHGNFPIVGEVGLGDAIMTAALVRDAARLGYGAIKVGGSTLASIARAIQDGVPAERFGQWMAQNAERVAGADARMAAGGSTVAPAALGQVPEQFGKPYPDIKGRVGDYQQNVLGEPSAEMIRDSRFPRDAVHPDLRAAGIGPEITPQVDMSGRANAAAGVVPESAPTDRLGAVNRALGQGVMSSVSGGVGAAVNQEMNPDDPYAGVKGFAVGALAPPLIARGAGALARRAGATEGVGQGLLAAFGHVPTPENPNRAIAVGSDPSRRYEFRYRVADLGELVPSNLPSGAPNPAFPRELQPRARDRVASQLQIDQIARSLEPDALLTDVGRLDSGPMIVGPDNIVESGNGRTLALQRAAREYPEQYAAYVDALRRTLPDYGLAATDMRGVRHPVLVRERVTSVDRPAFAQEANNAGLLRMSSFEQAVQDAGNLSDDAVTGLRVGENDTIASALRKTDNRDVVRQWVGTLPENERAGVLDASGDLSAQGYERMTNALLVRTYGQGAGERLARAFIESADPTVRNVQTALMASLPDVARSESLIRSGQRDAGLSIADDVATATDMLARLRRDGVSVRDYLGQSAMFERELTPLQENILDFLATNQRRPSTIREALKAYASRVENAADPNQVDMFGGQVAAPSREDLWRGATAGTEREAALTPLESAAQNPPTGRAPADGAGLASGAAEPVALPAPERPAARPVAPRQPQRPGPVPDDLLPRSGPEGTLAQEGAPVPLARPTQAERGTLPTGGQEGTLAVEGAPPEPAPPLAEFAQRLLGDVKQVPEADRPPKFILNVANAIKSQETRAATWGDRFAAVGYSSMIGPATATVNVPGNVIETMWSVGRHVATQNPRVSAYELSGVGDGMARMGLAMIDAIAGRTPTNPHFPIIQPANAADAALFKFTELGKRVFTDLPDAMKEFGRVLYVNREAGKIVDEEIKAGTLAADAARTRFNQLTEGYWAGRAEPNTPLQMPEFERIDRASDLGSRRDTFQDALSTRQRDFQQGIQAMGPIGHWLFPFFGTPAKMLERIAEKTPVGLAIGKDVRPPSERAFDAVVGTALLGGLVALNEAGGIQVTGSGPQNAQQRKGLESEGWRQKSVIVGPYAIPQAMFGEWAPVLQTIGEIRDAQKYGPEKKDPATFDRIADAAKRLGSVVGDFPYLRGFGDLIDFLSDPAANLESFAERNAARMVPYAGTLKAVAQSQSDVERRPDRAKDIGIPEAATQRAEQYLPTTPLNPTVNSQQVPATQDVLGRPNENPRQGPGGVFLPRFGVAKPDPTIQAFRDANVGIGAPPDKVTIDGIPLDLTPSEQRQWQASRGQILEKYAGGMTQRPWWNRPDAREAGMKQLLQEANEAASLQIQKTIGAVELRRRIREAAQAQRKAS